MTTTSRALTNTLRFFGSFATGLAFRPALTGAGTFSHAGNLLGKGTTMAFLGAHTYRSIQAGGWSLKTPTSGLNPLNPIKLASSKEVGEPQGKTLAPKAVEQQQSPQLSEAFKQAQRQQQDALNAVKQKSVDGVNQLTRQVNETYVTVAGQKMSLAQYYTRKTGTALIIDNPGLYGGNYARNIAENGIRTARAFDMAFAAKLIPKAQYEDNANKLASTYLPFYNATMKYSEVVGIEAIDPATGQATTMNGIDGVSEKTLSNINWMQSQFKSTLTKAFKANGKSTDDLNKAVNTYFGAALAENTK
jgi:hypothetical protein